MITIAKLPGLGIFSGGLLFGKMAKDGIKSKTLNNIVNDKDNRQQIIQDVLNEVYTTWDIMQLAKQYYTIHTNDVYKSLVKKWCDKFDIEFNPYCVLHHPKSNGIEKMYCPIDISDEMIYNEIRNRLN